MSNPAQVTVGKAILTLIEDPEVFDMYKGTLGPIYLEIRQQPSSFWVGTIKSDCGLLMPSLRGYISPEAAAQQLEHQVETFVKQLTNLLPET